jgi:hypothetical protein
MRPSLNPSKPNNLCPYPHLVLIFHLDKPPTPSPENNDPGRLLLGELPDPENRFSQLSSFHSYEMMVPPVFDADGELILPADYKDSIPQGTLVAIRGTMRM